MTYRVSVECDKDEARIAYAGLTDEQAGVLMAILEHFFEENIKAGKEEP